jgi:hypothetical protein
LEETEKAKEEALVLSAKKAVASEPTVEMATAAVPPKGMERIDAEKSTPRHLGNCSGARRLNINQMMRGNVFGTSWFYVDGTGEPLMATTCTDHPQPWFNGYLDTEISVYSSRTPDCTNLRFVSYNNNHNNIHGVNCDKKSRADFYAQPGQRYYIRVGARGGMGDGYFGIQVKRR